MSCVLAITADNYEAEVPASPLPVLLDFGAEWCAPCKRLSPIVEDVARRYEGRLKVGYVDVGASPQLAQRFKVLGVPTLLFLRAGRVVRQSGMVSSADQLTGLVDEILAGA